MNILKVTKVNTIFLLIILIAGTFNAIFPSFFIIEEVQAQTAEPEFGHDNNNYNYNSAEYYPPSYGSNDGYQPKNPILI